MRRKKTLYIILMAAGAVLLLGALASWRLSAPDKFGGMLTGAGSGLLAMGFANWSFARRAERDPVQMRRDEIAANDERIVAIRRRAQAVSGLALHRLWRAAVDHAGGGGRVSRKVRSGAVSDGPVSAGDVKITPVSRLARRETTLIYLGVLCRNELFYFHKAGFPFAGVWDILLAEKSWKL